RQPGRRSAPGRTAAPLPRAEREAHEGPRRGPRKNRRHGLPVTAPPAILATPAAQLVESGRPSTSLPRGVRMSLEVWVGTSGYVYPEWAGAFYPPGTSSRKML